MATKKSFVLFNDLSDPVQSLSNEEAGKLFKAIFEYQNGGIEQELSGASEMAFTFIKQQLDRNHERYELICERNRRNGAKGGRPKSISQKELKSKNPDIPKKPNGLSGNPDIPKKPDTDNDSDSENDTDTDTDIEDKNVAYFYLAELLYELHQKEDIKFEKPLSHRQTWANDIRLLFNDGRSKEDIESVIRWCQQPGCFWYSNIISGKKLRKQFDTMFSKMNQEIKKPDKEKPIFPKVESPISDLIKREYAKNEQ